MKYELVPEISVGILADEIRLQFNVEPEELIAEFNDKADYSFKFYYDELAQNEWRAQIDKGDRYTDMYTQFLMAASIFEDICPDRNYVIITRG